MIFRYSRLSIKTRGCDRVLYNGDDNSAFALYCILTLATPWQYLGYTLATP